MRVNKGFALNRIKGKHDYAERIIRYLESQIDSFETGEELDTFVERRYGSNIFCWPDDHFQLKLSDYADGCFLICEMNKDGLIEFNTTKPLYVIFNEPKAAFKTTRSGQILVSDMNWQKGDDLDVLGDAFEDKETVTINQDPIDWVTAEDTYGVAIPLDNDTLRTVIIAGGT